MKGVTWVERVTWGRMRKKGSGEFRGYGKLGVVGR